jgi:hypothetical protein
MSREHFLGIYLEPEDLINTGWDVGRVLDLFHKKGRINDIFFRVYAYNMPHIWYFEPDASYYEETTLVMPPQLDLPFDVMRRVCTEAEKRGMNVHVYIFPSKETPTRIVNHESVLEIDPDGQPERVVCFNNPDYKAHFFGVVRDLCASYPIRGAMYASERGGPLLMFPKERRRPTCFCPHCQATARARGMDPERAREGYRLLMKLYAGETWGSIEYSQRAPERPPRQRPSDGFFVETLRIFSRYPEVLFWNHMWHESQLALQRGLFEIVKASEAARPVGYHLWHRGRGFSPMMRAEEDYRDVVGIADFVKPAIFTNPAGMRFIQEVMNQSLTMFADLAPELVAQMLYAFLGYPNEGTIEQIKNRPFSTKYVTAEVRMAKERLAGSGVHVYAGIAAAHYKSWTTTPEYPADVKADIQAAVEAGADGFIFGSVDPSNEGLIAAIGESLHEIGWV